jgi:hypothetical protein
MYHLNWKNNISPYVDYFNSNISIYFYTHGLVDAINASRLDNLYHKTVFFFKYNKFKTLHENFKYSIFLKNLYFVLLQYNTEYTLIYFFFFFERILNSFENLFYEKLSERLKATFKYRYYYLTIILDHDRYKD